MPRFTNDPGAMSRATSRARSSRPSGVSDVWMDVWTRLISGHLFCGAGAGTAGINTDDAVDVNAGRHDVLRVQRTGGHDLGDLDDRVFRGGGHDRAEVPGRLAVDQVPDAVGLQRLDQRH